MSPRSPPPRRGRVAERPAEVLPEVLVLALRDFVQRIVVIHAEEVARLDPLFPQRAEDRVVNEHAAQRADVHAAARGLRVIDDLRAVHCAAISSVQNIGRLR